MRNGMGSWAFVISALVFLAIWMVFNGNHGFDKYPFILLNLVLSCLAALQGAILLIAAKRQDQIASELAMHDYETNLEADQIIKQVHSLTAEIHALLRQQAHLNQTVLTDPASPPDTTTHQTVDHTHPHSIPAATSPAEPTP